MPSSASTTKQIYTLSLHDALPILEDKRVLAGTQVHVIGFGTGANLDDMLLGTLAFKHNGRYTRAESDVTLKKFFSSAFGDIFENGRSEEHTSELQSHSDLVCRLLLRRQSRYTLFPYTTLFRSWRISVS